MKYSGLKMWDGGQSPKE